MHLVTFPNAQLVQGYANSGDQLYCCERKHARKARGKIHFLAARQQYFCLSTCMSAIVSFTRPSVKIVSNKKKIKSFVVD